MQRAVTVQCDLGGCKQTLRLLDVVSFTRVNARMLAWSVGRKEQPQHGPHHSQSTCVRTHTHTHTHTVQTQKCDCSTIEKLHILLFAKSVAALRREGGRGHAPICGLALFAPPPFGFHWQIDPLREFTALPQTRSQYGTGGTETGMKKRDERKGARGSQEESRINEKEEGERKTLKRGNCPVL